MSWFFIVYTCHVLSVYLVQMPCFCLFVQRSNTIKLVHCILINTYLIAVNTMNKQSIMAGLLMDFVFSGLPLLEVISHFRF